MFSRLIHLIQTATQVARGTKALSMFCMSYQMSGMRYSPVTSEVVK